MAINYIDKTIKQLTIRQEGLANERDKLRELLDEISMQLENCEYAIECIESAVDKLSELV